MYVYVSTASLSLPYRSSMQQGRLVVLVVGREVEIISTIEALAVPSLTHTTEETTTFLNRSVFREWRNEIIDLFGITQDHMVL